jgi:hypothetical protein
MRSSMVRFRDSQLTRIQDTIQEKHKTFASTTNKSLLKNSLVSLLYGAVFLATTATASGRRMVPQDVISASPTD